MKNRLKTLALTSCAVIALATAAHAQDTAKFDIAGGDLKTALQTFATQTSQEVLFSTDIVAGRRTKGVSAETDPQTALVVLLDGTGLTYQRTPTGTLLVVRASDPQSGSAAGDGANSGTVQALIVTAQKREENIQDVPIAMSAFTQEDLTKSQVTGGPDLMTQVPNFTFTKTNFTGYSIQIRGIGTQAISATTDAAVAVAFNNTPFIRNRFFEQEFYDLQRVEVLRGPQGTLYGRNATAGVVNIISAKPSFHYESKLSADVGNYNSTRLEGMINLPLVDDKVAVRLAGAWTKRDGYDTNQLTGNRIDGRDLWSTRLSLRVEPTDNIHANLIWEHFNEQDDRLRSGKQLCNTDEVTNVAGFTTTHYQTLAEYGQSLLFSGVQGTFSQGCKATSLYAPESFQTPNGIALPYYLPLQAISLPVALDDPYASRTQSTDLRMIESSVDPKYRAKSDLGELQLSVDLSHSLTLTSELAYNRDVIWSMEDFNRFNTAPGAWDTGGNSPNTFVTRGILSPEGVFCDPQIGCSDRLVGIDLSTAKSTQFSEEIRLASDYEGPFNFSLGANFLRYDTEDKYYVFFNSLSLYAVGSGLAGIGGGDYVPGVTDNANCFPNGMLPPDPTQIYEVTGCIYIDPNPIGSLNDQGHNYFLSRNPYKLISYAIFGESYYNITKNLKLTTGLRWTVDKKEAPRIPSWVLAAKTVGYPVAEVVEQEWREPTGRLALDWKPKLSFTDETLVYGSYAHGYKAGGANPPAAGPVIYCSLCQGNVTSNAAVAYSAAHPKTFEPEFVNAFEIGSKNTLLDGRLTLNGDAFFYDYTGYQISQIVDRSAVNLNFDSKVWGAELEADWRPLESLRFGLKLGYERTRVDDNAKAIDLMDRTAGNPDWVLVRPFPTFPSNCILPAWLFIGHTGAGGLNDTNPALVNVGGRGGGNMGGCEQAYLLGNDPATGLAYSLYPYRAPGDWPGEYFRTNVNYAAWNTDLSHYPGWPTGEPLGTEYPGFDPSAIKTISNNGAGIFKHLGGNELPNAPHITATLTADYTLPLPNDWLATLHGDFYYQSESWARIFNTPGYDKLKAYNNVNLAAIFTNEEAGWKIMAYVKNVFDRANITGAFLNSDDTGLTTNVFLNEPRLYGLRVTKEWTGGPWWTGASTSHPAGEPYPLTVEVGGQVQHQDGNYDTLAPAAFADFPSELTPTAAQHGKLDWGDGRELKLTYRPSALWQVSAAMRYGRANTGTTRVHSQVSADKVCGLPLWLPLGHAFCDPTYSAYGEPAGTNYHANAFIAPKVNADSAAYSREEHLVADFSVGKDVGLGGLSGAGATLGLGLRYARLRSHTEAAMSGIPYEYLPEGWFLKYTHHTRYEAALRADREFKGMGPLLTWDAAEPLMGNDDTGRLSVDWSVRTGALFGKQKTSVKGEGAAQYFSSIYWFDRSNVGDPQPLDINLPTRTKSKTVPMVDLSLGLSYEVQRIKVGAGYRWERYFNALDVGYAEPKSADRTIDGPYFKIAVGFGG
jgi:outer membrane receptor protein involved in Fe transport